MSRVAELACVGSYECHGVVMVISLFNLCSVMY